MKAKITLLSTFVLFTLSCNLFANTATPVPVMQTAASTATMPPTNTPIAVEDTVTLNNVTIAIPQGLAQDALSEMVSAVTDPNAAPWETAPDHLKFTLTGYQLQDKFHQPRIFVYPAEAYAQLQPGAAESIKRIKMLTTGAPLSKELMPGVVFFNAGQLISSKMEVFAFQDGSGIRFLAEYAQYPATINNHELVYLFQGLTNDGKNYILAILPITAPILAETDKPDAAIPAGGVPVPADTGPNETYYADITDKLNMLAEDDFQPSLSALDALVQSMVVAP